MRRREDAVAWLQARGLHAFVRDWALGRTIGVAARAIEGPGGITILEHLHYLCPGPDGGWIVADLPTNEDTPCASLHQAAEFAVHLIERRDRANA